MQQWKKNWRREAQRYWTFQHQTRSANRTAFMLESKPVNWWFEGKNETQYRRKKTNQTKVLTKTPDYREQSVQQNWKRKLSLKRALPFSNCRTANLAERSSIKHYRLHAQQREPLFSNRSFRGYFQLLRCATLSVTGILSTQSGPLRCENGANERCHRSFPRIHFRQPSQSAHAKRDIPRKWSTESAALKRSANTVREN